MGSACKSDLSVRYKESGIEEMRRQLGIFQQQSQNIIDSELLDETVHKKFQRQQSLTLCLVGVKIERTENIGRKRGWKTVFSTVWQIRENGEEGKLGRKFSLLGPKFSSSQIGRKIWRGKCRESTFTQIPSPNVYNNLTWQNKKEA